MSGPWRLGSLLSRRTGLALPLLVGAALRLVRLSGPVVGIHSWRQADTAAMARHFAETGMRWWLPQIDWGGASPGYVEAEFPLYPYLVAGLYRLLGQHDWLARGLSVSASLLTLWLVVRLGRRLLGDTAGWWGGMAWATLPLTVYYGRTVQAESLLLCLAALALERFLCWQDHGRPRDLLLSWLAFSGCGLLKVLPLLWLGLPLAWLWLRRQGLAALFRSWIVLYPLGAALLCGAWYWHAHQLGASSGLSFGFWMGDTNRYAWSALLHPSYWLDLGLRTGIRGLGVIGVPLLVIGAPCCLWSNRSGRDGQARAIVDPERAPVLLVGLGAVLLAGATAPESSGVHEYYQLPLLLFACPLIGEGLHRLERSRLNRAWAAMVLMLTVCLTILVADYWLVEWRQEQQLLPIARAIQQQTTASQRVVSVTGSDPTLLNLARRQGWLTSPRKVTTASLQTWEARGADVIAGSFDVMTSYTPFENGRIKQRLRQTLCAEHTSACDASRRFYVLPLGDAGDRPGSIQARP